MALFGGKKCIEWKKSCASMLKFFLYSLLVMRVKYMDLKIAGSWIFVVAQALHRFEHLLKSSSDGHVSFS